jgi:prepilin-type N-terminal cleavage/methylation domain-containing protein
MRKSGYTLIEILIVIGILGIVAVIGSNMFFAILRNTAKSQILAEVKQNGNYALSVMSRMIRNARSIDACPGDSITLTNPDRETTTFSCEGARVASNSGVFLTSDKVLSSACNFSCAGTTPETVTVSFTLTQASDEERIEEKATLDFRTTVSLRTY